MHVGQVETCGASGGVWNRMRRDANSKAGEFKGKCSRLASMIV